ncbi:MAG TPA: hypothetical protein VHA09_02380 [Nitrososphaera sp.]|nr:hypothetical protein [Nitrososphaera sp.]
MLLPESCSVKVDGIECRLPPSYVVSIKSQKEDGGNYEEYMVAVVCDDHKDGLEFKLASMQKAGRAPTGKIHFQAVKAVVTDCVAGMEEDYIEIELKRGIKPDLKET